MTSIDYRDPEWVSVQLGVERNTVYRWLKDGTLPGLLIGRRWLVSESQLGEFLQSKTERQTKVRRIVASKKPFGQRITDGLSTR